VQLLSSASVAVQAQAADALGTLAADAENKVAINKSDK
jgi:hypothetical protein